MHIYIALNDDEFGAHYINFYLLYKFLVSIKLPKLLRD